MRQRLPLVLSATALAVSLLGATSLGQAAGNAVRAAVPVALYANNAGKLNDHTSSGSPTAGQIPVVDAAGNLPSSILDHAFDQRRLTTTSSRPTRLGVAEVTTLTATCPEGTIVIGGGYDVHMIEAGNPRVDSSRPDPPNRSWQIDVYNIPVLDRQGQLATHPGRGKAIAVCART